MSDALLLALLRGYYVPDMDYTFSAPPVCTAFWSAQEWALYVTPFPLSTH